MGVTQIEPKTASAGVIAERETGSRKRLANLVEPMGGPRVVSAALGGLIATSLWIGMFTVGLSVPSSPFRDGLLALAGGEPAPGAFRVNGALDAVYAIVIIAFCYTPTNLAMLCCLAALVGCFAYTATNSYVTPRESQVLVLKGDADGESKAAKAEPIPLRPTISAITWGFFIYLFMISGALLAVDNPFAATSPDQYLRLAGMASLLAFVVGWRPELIAKLVTQVGSSRFSGQESGKA